MDREFFVQNIKKTCLLKGIKPTVACRESGVGTSFINDIIRGQTPSVAKVQMLAEYLGVTTSELLGERVTNSSTDIPLYLVTRYNSFPPSVQQEVIAFIEFKTAQLAEQEAAEKKDDK